jgi:hypothetical protein
LSIVNVLPPRLTDPAGVSKSRDYDDKERKSKLNSFRGGRRESTGNRPYTTGVKWLLRKLSPEDMEALAVWLRKGCPDHPFEYELLVRFKPDNGTKEVRYRLVRCVG